jgi:hypothetical protein
MTTNVAKTKKLTICRLGGGSGSSNSTLSRSISPSSAEGSFLNRSNQEENYYSFYPSNNEEEKNRSTHNRFLTNIVRDNELHLPEDPRSWLREDVQTWIRHMVESHGLPSVQTDRFLMNGKALCLMSMEMFCQRVPLGGKLLFKDFQLRLATAMCN